MQLGRFARIERIAFGSARHQHADVFSDVAHDQRGRHADDFRHQVDETLPARDHVGGQVERDVRGCRNDRRRGFG
uniref:Uncharacterized protein n=1 Tax=Burkholderia cenocepacia TaxID=95486 RepID=A0A071M2M5_9BURK